jgi:glycosyltransferase involved in cell wall biosynthesis
MNQSPSITLLVMALNEIEGLKNIMPKIDRDQFKQIIIVDGDSRDGTKEWAIENGYEVFVQSRKGLRSAYQEVWPMIISDYVITFSPDGNCDPTKMDLLVESILREKPDMVIGSRYLPGVRSEDDDFVTAFGNWVFNFLARMLFGGNLTDVMVIYRGFRTNLPEELGLLDDSPYVNYEKYFFTRISWEPLMAARVLHEKKYVLEVPAGEPPRLYGERKLQIIRWGASYFLQFVFEKFRRAGRNI